VDEVDISVRATRWLRQEVTYNFSSESFPEEIRGDGESIKDFLDTMQALNENDPFVFGPTEPDVTITPEITCIEKYVPAKWEPIFRKGETEPTQRSI
jgi:hypothetical protein